MVVKFDPQTRLFGSQSQIPGDGTPLHPLSHRHAPLTRQILLFMPPAPFSALPFPFPSLPPPSSLLDPSWTPIPHGCAWRPSSRSTCSRLLWYVLPSPRSHPRSSIPRWSLCTFLPRHACLAHPNGLVTGTRPSSTPRPIPHFSSCLSNWLSQLYSCMFHLCSPLE